MNKKTFICTDCEKEKPIEDLYFDFGKDKICFECSGDDEILNEIKKEEWYNDDEGNEEDEDIPDCFDFTHSFTDIG